MFLKIESEYLGLVDYSQAYEIQKNKWNSVQSNEKHICIFGLEHPDVITLGRRATDLEVFSTQIPVVKSTRGGLATLHSPGQLVVYPILQVRPYFGGVRNYVAQLLEITSQVFKKYYDVQTHFDEANAGLYTEKGKIAFCGLEIKSGVSLHGLSININNNVELFQQIRPCGLNDLCIDQLSNYNKAVSVELFFQNWMIEFKKYISEQDKTFYEKWVSL